MPGDESISSVEGTFVERKRRPRSGKCGNSVRKEKFHANLEQKKLNWLFKETAQLRTYFLMPRQK